MTDTPKLPKLPPPQWARDHHGETEVYTEADMLAYGAQAAREQRERDAALVDRTCTGTIARIVGEEIITAILAQPEPQREKE